MVVEDLNVLREVLYCLLSTSVYGLDYDEQNTVSWMGITPLKWGIDPDDEECDILERAYNVGNIATHEVGHVVGLDDLYAE